VLNKGPRDPPQESTALVTVALLTRVRRSRTCARSKISGWRDRVLYRLAGRRRAPHWILTALSTERRFLFTEFAGDDGGSVTLWGRRRRSADRRSMVMAVRLSSGTWIARNGRECDLVARLAPLPMPIPGWQH